jgi:PadR family transcriptional regulator PadR
MKPQARADILHGTLALMVLRTIEVLGPIHGYGIARRIEQISKGLLNLNQGTLYPSLLQLEQAGWVSAKWGVSDNNRKARFYSITRSGRKQLAAEAENWRRISEVIGMFADASEGKL